MTDSDTGRIKKTDQAQKIRTEICRIFLIAKWHLIHYTSTTYSKYVVVAGVKLKILKANHNEDTLSKKTKHEAQDLNSKSLKAMIKNCHLWECAKFWAMETTIKRLSEKKIRP